jgi:hypothetical protein
VSTSLEKELRDTADKIYEKHYNEEKKQPPKKAAWGELIAN